MSQSAPEQQPVFDPYSDASVVLPQIDSLLPVRLDQQISGPLSGDYQARYKGSGLERDGVRQYVSGDDPRNIDWKATARTFDGDLLVRERFKEITPQVWLVSDLARDRYTKNPGYFTEQSLGFSALLAMGALAERQNMPTGLLVANDMRIIGTKIPASGIRNRVRHVEMIKTAVQEHDSQGSTKLSDVLQIAAKRCVGSLVIVVSDFRDDSVSTEEASWALPLRQIASKNQVIAIETTNAWDFKLNEHIGRYKSGDNKFNVLTGKKGSDLRERYADAANHQQRYIDATISSIRAPHLTLSTARPDWATSLQEQLFVATRSVK